MRFLYSPHMQQTFPKRMTGLLELDGIQPDIDVTTPVTKLTERALNRLQSETEGSFSEIQAWRRAYSTMGLKPTQYRCASEALLRRLRKDGSLPKLHPLIDLCNAASVAYAVPVAVFDLDHVKGDLCVRQANGNERYLAFSGTIETPEVGEIIFADEANDVHARRWANRQSRSSAISDQTTKALIVTEALHDGAQVDIESLMQELAGMIAKSFRIDAKPEKLLPTEEVFISKHDMGAQHVG